MIGIDAADAVLASAKTGLGVEDIPGGGHRQVPPPREMPARR